MASRSREPNPRPGEPNVRNIILAGFMGSGKSTVGKVLARRLGWKFLDTDRLISERAGRSIPSIFKELGEPAFRTLEREAAGRLEEGSRCVIATGGGFMLDPANRTAAERAGEVVFLVASPEEIWHRVRRSRHRPLLDVDDPMARIQELLRDREPAYSAIAHRVATDGQTPEAIAERILENLRGR